MSFQISSPNSSPWGTPTDERPRTKRQPSHIQRHPAAPPPAGYQQTGSSYGSIAPTGTPGGPVSNDYFPRQPPSQPGTPSMQTYGAGYGGAAGGVGGDGQGGYPQQQQQQGAVAGYAQPGAGVEGLQQQMGGMSLNSEAPTAARRKKDRHAYHQIEQSQQQSFNAPTQGSPQFLQNGQAVGQAAAVGSPQAAPWQQQGQTPNVPQGDFQASTQPQGTPISMAPQQGMPGSAPGQKVNPAQIPSVPLSRDLPAEYYKSHVYPTMDQHLPPPVTTPFIAYDQGNSSPKYARLTMNCIPASYDQLAATGLPLGLALQPLAKQGDGEQAIPVLDFGDSGPPRCRRCRAYINPFMIFSNGGNRMTCNLCGHPNEVAPEYFAPTDPGGFRVDRQQRPELTLGTCEFLVPKEYWSKEPVPMRYLFLIDVSMEACTRGFLQGVCDGILQALYGSEDEPPAEVDDADDGNGTSHKLAPGAKVGFMTFDREIHFYHVEPSLPAPRQMVMNDLEDPYSTIASEHFFVDPIAAKPNIEKLLRSIPRMFLQIKHAEPTLLPSLQAALATLEPTGGKVIASLASLPTHGPGRLFLRDKGASPNDDGEYTKNLLKTEHPGYKKVQAEYVKAGVGIDFFLASPAGGYLDIATIGFVAEKTGGETFYFPNWTYPRDCLRLAKEISHNVQCEQGYAALMKVRCSNGLQVAHYSGNFTQHTFGADLEMANIRDDTGLCVTFSYDGKLDPKFDAHFQSALLYTTSTGERRVRCSNLVATVSETARDSMRLVDQDAVITVLAKEAASKVAIDGRSMSDVRKALQDKTTDILAGYRKHFSGSHPQGQLVLPENLKEFAMYVLGLIKSRAIKGGKEPSDRRVFDLRLIRSMSPSELSLYLYPRIIALHNLDETEGFADENGYLKVPQAVRASFGSIEEGGVYLVDSGQILLLWLHAQVSPNLLEDLFGEGVSSLQSLDANLSSLPVLETHLNAQVRNIILHLEQQRGTRGLAIQLARQGLDGAEFEFARLLYEDRNGEASSYVDWLVMLHRSVNSDLAGQKSKATNEGDSAVQGMTNAISSITGSVPYWG
ncbi:beta-sandwich domain of Sec23/24 [Polychaeton citri CBS 116435]|uniref:Beta-sandwich domain of Sec23/24 n=1 Tax=Polychaeton citri CBS 116435 TaxID=1314669 RepID=A0A9P4Q2T4_9PEZI|nr:beta-sandwich domain of Sec23/24 [Polychaeton citri CBS 116435]